MVKEVKFCILALLFFVISASILTAPSKGAEEFPYDPIDGGTAYKAEFFECNGTYQEKYGVWWLASSNPFQFRRRFTAKWYFSGIPIQNLQVDTFIVKLSLAVYTNSIESGGKPTSASVELIVRNPDTDEEYSIDNIRVEMNKDEISIPTYVYIPAFVVTSDGRTILELKGGGQIGVNMERAGLIVPAL